MFDELKIDLLNLCATITYLKMSQHTHGEYCKMLQSYQLYDYQMLKPLLRQFENLEKQKRLQTIENNIRIIVEQTGCTYQVALTAYKKYNGDVIDAILSLV